MENELKKKLDQQYHEMWDVDHKEIIGAPIVAILIFAFAFLFFLFAT